LKKEGRKEMLTGWAFPIPTFYLYYNLGRERKEKGGGGSRGKEKEE